MKLDDVLGKWVVMEKGTTCKVVWIDKFRLQNQAAIGVMNGVSLDDIVEVLDFIPERIHGTIAIGRKE